MVTRISVLQGHAQSVYAITGDTSGNIYSGGGDKIVVRWGPEKEGTLIARTVAPVFSLYWDELRNTLWIGLSNGYIHLIDLASGKEIKSLQASTKSIFHIMQWRENIFASTAGGEIIKMDPCGNISATGKFTDQKIRRIRLAAKGDTLSLACSDGNIRLIDDKLVLQSSAKLHDWAINDLLWMDGGNYLLSAGKDAHLRLWDVRAGMLPVLAVPAHNYAIYGIEKHPFLPLLVSVSRDKTIKLWNAETLDFRVRIDYPKFGGHKYSVNCLWMDPLTGMFATGSDDKTIIRWNIIPEET